MKSKTAGKDTSQVEVLNISKNGFWLLADQEEHFLSFDDFPWFRSASVSQILNVENPTPNHFFWPDIDVDLEIESIKSPDKYPLIYRE